MKKALQIVFSGALALAVLAALGLSLLYVTTETVIRRTYDEPLRPIAVPSDANSIEEGRRLATIRGCNDGCHGKGVSGGVFWEQPWVARMVAPDLTRVARNHSDAELERVIRRGVRKNGRSTMGMPSSMLHHLSDADLGRILAFLRSQPPGNGPDTDIRFGPLGRIDILKNPTYAYAEEIAHDAPWLTDEQLRGKHGRGRYLALTVCTECHGMDLKGAKDGTAPDLVAAAAYTEEQFAHLMKTGEPIGARKLDLMALVAQERFSYFTDEEVHALYDYLQARAGELL